ncbi:hypothetical protein JW979_09840 [bacterium]|nr:hypothetical protein [candidate division CSSED10-310 bacterium]
MKELLICFIKDSKKVEEILTGFLDMGITGATVLEGRGMGEIITHDIPVFSGLLSLFPRGDIHTHVILSVLDQVMVGDAIALVHEVCGDLMKPGTGMIITIPVKRVSGLAHEL